MIRNIFVFVVVVFFAVGFVGTVSAQQNDDGFEVVNNSAAILSSQSNRQTSKVAQTETTTVVEKGTVKADCPIQVQPVRKSAPKPQPKKVAGCCDDVRRLDKQINDQGGLKDTIVDQGTRLGNLETTINGKDGQKGLVTLLGDEASARTEKDNDLQSQINAIKGLVNGWNWWDWLILFLVLLALVLGTAGLFLPRGHTHANGVPQVNQNVPPANANATAVADIAPPANNTVLGLTAPNQTVANQPANTTNLVGQNRVATTPILAPPPSITAISNSIKANMIPVSGGLPITLFGTGFMRGCEVYFGGTRSESVTFDNLTRIIALAPAAEQAGLADVRVVNPDGQEFVLTNGAQYFGF